MGTFVVAVILITVCGLIIRSLYKDKKSGKGSCGGNCSRCKGCH